MMTQAIWAQAILAQAILAQAIWAQAIWAQAKAFSELATVQPSRVLQTRCEGAAKPPQTQWVSIS
jgi:hypothetical protein